MLHPIQPHLEGQNLWDIKDVEGTYAIQNISNIASANGEGFATWWWKKPNDIENNYEKIGFGKYFAPFDWFIGTGDYVSDYEEELKQQFLEHIDDIRYDDNGYIFVIDNQGVVLSHIKKSYVGQNRIDVIDANGTFMTKEIIQAAKEGEKYISYVATVQPSTGEAGEKISYIKGFKDWQWAIGSGTYFTEIEAIINEKREALNESNSQKILQITLLSIFMSLVLFIVTLLFSNNIKRRFQIYQEKVKDKTEKLDSLNKHLEEQVADRTQKLEDTIDSLKNTQTQLIESEKMASLGGLVAGVAHEINTPVGIGLTGITHFIDITQSIKLEYDNQEMTAESFEEYIASANELGQIININLQRTADLIKSFKQISVDQTREEKRLFNVPDYIKEILLSLKNVTKKSSVKVKTTCDMQLNIHSYPGSLSQIITNLIINSVKHGFSEGKDNLICIDIEHSPSVLTIHYYDNGSGIPKENVSKIFEPFFTTNRESGGTGLGLNIIYNIITTTLKGTIECKLPLDGGVHFVITLPLVA